VYEDSWWTFLQKTLQNRRKEANCWKGEGIILDMKYFLKGHLDRPRLGIFFFKFDLVFFKWNSKFYSASRPELSNYEQPWRSASCRRQLRWFCLEFGYPMKNQPKRRVTRPLKLGKAHGRSLNNPAAVPAFILFGLQLGKHNIFADLLKPLVFRFWQKRLNTLNF